MNRDLSNCEYLVCQNESAFVFFEKKKIVIFISRLKTWLSHRDIADLIGLVPDRNNKVQEHSPHHHHYANPHQN